MIWTTWLAMILALLVANAANGVVKGLEKSEEFMDIEPQHSNLSLSHDVTSAARNIKILAWGMFCILAYHNGSAFF